MSVQFPNKARAVPNRRDFLGAASAVAAAGTFGCGGEPVRKQAGPFAGRELRVFCYSGGHEKTMQDEFVPAFEKETGAAVTLHPGWWEGIAKLKTAGSGETPFDLIISDATQGYPAIKDGLFAQLDLAKIPNAQLQFAPTLDNWVVRERYGITYPDSVMTLAYNKNLVKEPPASWSDLLKPELKGKIGLYNSFYLSLFTFACMKASLEGKAGTAHKMVETDLDGVLAFAKAHREQVKLWWPTSTDMILALANKDAHAGNMHSPEYIQALREKPELGAVVPSQDRAFVQVFWAIPARAKNADMAHKAIDMLFSEALQLAFARKGSATANLSAAQKMAADDPFWKQIYPHTKEQFKTLQYYPYEVYAKSWDRIGEVWDRTVLRNG